MPNILTAQEAATVLRCTATDPNMLAVLPSIDAFIERSTGRDWTIDNPVCEEAKNAARMLLVQWYENPGMTGGDPPSLGFGLSACLMQLKTLAFQYFEFYGGAGSGAVRINGANRGDTVGTLIGLINATGDQKAKFESVISQSGYIEQISTEDLSETLFRVHLIPPGEL
ncbi:MAG: hypothetical protein ABFD14_03885 [Anaerolineaceae bacterium]